VEWESPNTLSSRRKSKSLKICRFCFKVSYFFNPFKLIISKHCSFLPFKKRVFNWLHTFLHFFCHHRPHCSSVYFHHNLQHSLNINDMMTRFSLTFPCHCALNAVSAILTEGASLKQIIKIRNLVNTFKNWGTKFKFTYKNWDQMNNLTLNLLQFFCISLFNHKLSLFYFILLVFF